MPFKDPEAKRAWRAAYNKSQHAKVLRAAWAQKRAIDPAVAQREQEAAELRSARRKAYVEYCHGIRQSLALISLRA